MRSKRARDPRAVSRSYDPQVRVAGPLRHCGGASTAGSRGDSAAVAASAALLVAASNQRRQPGPSPQVQTAKDNISASFCSLDVSVEEAIHKPVIGPE